MKARLVLLVARGRGGARLRRLRRRRLELRPGHAWRRRSPRSTSKPRCSPQGSVKSNLESLAKNVAGIDDLGGLIVSKLESSASRSGNERRLRQGSRALAGREGGDLLRALRRQRLHRLRRRRRRRTDTGRRRRASSTSRPSPTTNARTPPTKASITRSRAPTAPSIGVVGDFLVVAEDERAFKDAVDASKGEALADAEDVLRTPIAAAPSGSLADVYVDVGALIEQPAATIDPQALQVFKAAGIDPSEATALASVVPGSDQIEIDLSSDLGGESAPSGDASKLLGSLPAGSLRRLRRLRLRRPARRSDRQLDAEGVPGTSPPHQLKKALEQLGIDLEGIAASLEDAARLRRRQQPEQPRRRPGADTRRAPRRSDDGRQPSACSCAATRSPGVTASAARSAASRSTAPSSAPSRSSSPPRAADRDRLRARRPTLQGLSAESSQTLSDSPTYKAAVAALGGTPISGFVDGPAALRLAESSVPPSEPSFQKAKPYLAKVGYLASASGSRATWRRRS